MTHSRGYRPRNIRKGDPLTARELQVLALVAAGETTPAISKRLGIVENTIKSHLTSVYKKTGSANRVQAVRHYLHHYTSAAPGGAPAPSWSATVPLPQDDSASLISKQIQEIQARLEQLAPAASEVERLRDAVEALREIESR